MKIAAVETILLRIPYRHSGPPTGLGGKIWTFAPHDIFWLEEAQVEYSIPLTATHEPGTFPRLQSAGGTMFTLACPAASVKSATSKAQRAAA